MSVKEGFMSVEVFAKIAAGTADARFGPNGELEVHMEPAPQERRTPKHHQRVFTSLGFNDVAALFLAEGTAALAQIALDPGEDHVDIEGYAKLSILDHIDKAPDTFLHRDGDIHPLNKLTACVVEHS